jgi:hypothetical protein
MPGAGFGSESAKIRAHMILAANYASSSSYQLLHRIYNARSDLERLAAEVPG